MKEPISIKEILAIIIKRGKMILCFALIGAILGGAVQLRKELVNKSEEAVKAAEDKYLQEMAVYEEQRKLLEEAYLANEITAKGWQERIDNSIAMKIAPWGTPTSVITLTIGEKNKSFGAIYQEEGVSSDIIVNRILTIYEQHWEQISLKDELQDHPYKGFAEAFLREIVHFLKRENGVFEIVVFGLTSEDARALSDSIYSYLVSLEDAVANATYPHEIKIISRIDKTEDSTRLMDVQNALNNGLNVAVANFELSKQQLDALQEPQYPVGNSSNKTLIKVVIVAIAGAVIMALMACALIWMMYIVRDGVESSNQFAAILGVSFLADTAGKKDFFIRLGSSIVGERQWQDSGAAAQYAVECIKNELPVNANIVLASTLSIPEDEAGVQTLMTCLRENGYDVRYVNSAHINSTKIGTIRESGYVIMAERVGKSTRQPMIALRTVIQQMDAELLGFILV